MRTEIPGYYDPACWFQVHCGIGRWQHCLRFGGRTCGKCTFPAARRPGYYSASVCSREWLPQIVQVLLPPFFQFDYSAYIVPKFSNSHLIVISSPNGSFLRGSHCNGRTMINETNSSTRTCTLHRSPPLARQIRCCHRTIPHSTGKRNIQVFFSYWPYLQLVWPFIVWPTYMYILVSNIQCSLVTETKPNLNWSNFPCLL